MAQGHFHPAAHGLNPTCSCSTSKKLRIDVIHLAINNRGYLFLFEYKETRDVEQVLIPRAGVLRPRKPGEKSRSVLNLAVKV